MAYSNNGSIDIIHLIEERISRIEENQLRSVEALASQEAYKEMLVNQLSNVDESIKGVKNEMKETLKDAVGQITSKIDKISEDISLDRRAQATSNERILGLEIERNSRKSVKNWVLKVVVTVTAAGVVGFGTWFVQTLIN